ncbi:hypothetical protein GCM10022280_04650 [Sphingomonas swuensis]|uniref:UrcA family protein n=1 Tax=Sphingomonas swuensis TaxID=977800 RepID=A0ABP7SEG3_9SPHN
MRALLILAASAFAASLPATAAEPESVLVVQGSRMMSDSQRAVRYDDLSLASAQGREQLRTRVAFAIADLCDASRFSAVEPTDAMKCRAETWASVAPRLDQLSPRLASR